MLSHAEHEALRQIKKECEQLSAANAVPYVLKRRAPHEALRRRKCYHAVRRRLRLRPFPQCSEGPIPPPFFTPPPTMSSMDDLVNPYPPRVEEVQEKIRKRRTDRHPTYVEPLKGRACWPSWRCFTRCYLSHVRPLPSLQLTPGMSKQDLTPSAPCVTMAPQYKEG